MNKISDKQEYLIDRMLVKGYPIRVICEVAKVSRRTVQTRRDPLTWSGALGICYCACGEPLQYIAANGERNDPRPDHERVPCKKRQRRSRLLLRFNARWARAKATPESTEEGG